MDFEYLHVNEDNGGTAEFASSRLANTPERITKLEYFKIFRDYRMSQQELLNHRLTWTLAIQTILLGTYGYCAQKLLEISKGQGCSPMSESALTEIEVLMWTIALVGLVTSIPILLSVRGAWLALERLEKDWNRKVLPGREQPYIPDPAAAGVRRAYHLGFAAPFGIPLVFTGGWIAIIVSLVRMRFTCP